MKKFISILFFALAGVFSFALQGGVAHADWSTLNSSTTREFTSISCPEPRTCFLVSGLYLSGGSGAIVKTTDGGETFTLLKSPTLDPLHAVSCPSISTCYVAGDFGTFLKTTDGGETWSASSLGSKDSPPRFTNLWALDEQRVLVVGRDGVFYRTEDGGASWARPFLRSVSDFYGIYFTDASTGFVTGSEGALWITEDGGMTWTFRNTLHDAGQIFGIHGKGAQAIFVVGDAIHKSTDGGKTWTKQSAPAKSHQAITVVNADTAYLLADLNSIFKTTDGGATWKLETSVGNAALQGIACPSDGYCLVAGSSGKVLRLGTPPPPPPPPLPPPPPVVAVSLPSSTPPSLATPPQGQPPVVVEKPVAPSVAAPVTENEPPTMSEKVKMALSTVFTRTLRKGADGKDVKKLQEILASVSGIYPNGEATGYFGPATTKAVGRFQEKYDIAKPGKAGYGEVGPKTRMKLIEAAQNGTGAGAISGATKNSQTTPAVFVRTLKKGSRGNDVKKLQEILSADKELYPEGETSGYFGAATKKAVGKFQEKYELARPGDAGYGELGPKTRAKLIETAK